MEQKDRVSNQLKNQLQEARKQISELKNKLKQRDRIIESMSELVAFHNRELRVQWANKAACESVDLPLEKIVGRHCYEIWPNRKKPCEGCPVLKAIKKGGKQETEMTTPDGRAWLIRGDPVRDEQGKIIGAIEMTMEVTARREAEQKMIESEQRYRLIAENTTDYITLLNFKGKFIYLSPSHEQMGYKPEELIGRSGLDMIHPEDRKVLMPILSKYMTMKIKDLLSLEQKRASELIKFRFPDKSKIWHNFEATVNLVKPGKGRRYHILMISRDITQREKDETKLRASLKEKEVLLQEIHHRVKNNMQIIISLIRLQSSEIKDQRDLELFKRTQDRIHSMALIHEKLYQSQDFARVNFAKYLESFVVHLFHTYSIDPKLIKLNLDLEEIKTDINRAIPLGLILNELVSNAFKHAFPEGRKGEVSISLKGDGKKGESTLVVKDNGVGIPEQMDIKNPQTLGLQLVKDLVKQIKGKLSIRKESGTEIEVKF